VKLETEEIPGAEPALVFLHEGLGSIALWRDFPRRLAEATGRRALIYSRAGHGFSDVPDEPRTPRFMHDEALEVLPQVLSEHQIVNPVLVGHSDGGSIALIHASAYPVSGLVLLAPHVFVEDLTVASIEEARETFATTDLGEKMARYHKDPERTFRLWNDIWLAPEFRDWNIEDVLEHVTAPTLLIQGEHDQYGTLAQVDAIERGLNGPVTRVVLDAKHAPHLEAPEETLGAATRFISLQPHFAIPFERSFDAHYGLEYLEPTRGRVTITGELLGPDGTVRSGVYAAIAESLASTGTAVEVVPKGLIPSGLNNSTHVIGDARNGVLEGLARCRARGDGEWLWDVEIGPPEGQATAVATVAIAIRPARKTQI
jgi:pimeloyl-ACP methyl ester carboxylesterase/acyl-coenzyme A thioesterase PaaI-like protein